MPQKRIECFRQSSQWKPAGSPRPKKARQSKSTHKLLMIPFFDSTLQIGSVAFPPGQCTSPQLLVTDYLTKMGINTDPQPPYSPDIAPCDFCLFPMLRGCRYETIEEMKEAVTKVIDTLTQEDFDGAFQKLLERYKKCIAAGGVYFEGD